MKSQSGTTGSASSAPALFTNDFLIAQICVLQALELSYATGDLAGLEVPNDRELAPGWDSIPEIRVRVVRTSIPGELAVVARMGLQKVGEYVTDDKGDAISTAQAMVTEYERKGHTVKLFLK